MSLNRRLWNWLLGPDNEHSNSTVPASPTSEKKSVKDTDTTGGKISRSEYFKKYSLPTVSIILLDQIQNNPTQSIDQYVSVFKISLSLILDKWEISRALSPVLFLPIMRATHQCKLKKEVKDSDALLTAASSFFDTVEAMYIWNDLNRLICANDEMELVAFIVSNFDLNEEEMKEIHIPLGVVCLQKNKLDSKWFSILEILLQNINLESTIGAKPTSITSDISSSDILTYYDSLLSNHSTPPPYTPEVISQYIVSTFKSIVISSLNNSDYSISSKLCDLYVQLITVDSDKKLIEKMLNTPETDYSSSFDGKANLFSAFNLVKLLSVVHGSLSPMEKDKILKIIMNNYYYSLISQYPVNFQVEVVKSIFQLDKFYLKYQIEASILKLFIGTSSIIERIRALNNLWNHSSNHNDDDTILARPLFLILDELKAEEDELVVARFISSNVLKGGSSNRLLKLLTNPLLGFDFISDTNNVLKIDDDLGQFSYYLSTIVNVIKTNEKHLKESFNNELVVMDSTNKLHAITANSWDVSTYKSLLLNVIEKFLSLKLSDDILRNENDKYCNQFKGRYYQTISGCLKLYCLLITGNEVDFIKKFHSLIVNSSNIIDASTNDKSGFLEVVTDKYINCITVLLRVSEGQHVNLNLLHIEDKEKDPQLIKLMVIGIKNAQTVVLLESWTTLLTRTLYLFNESVFSVLLTLNDTLVFRIEDLFRQIKNKSDDENKKINYLHDIESSINVLAGGIEDLLTISHSYLLTSNLRARGDLNGSGGNSNGPNGSSNGATSNSSGFFGNVIQGVFLIESPAIRTTEENKKYSILLAFQDAISVGSKIWMWAETSGTSTDNRTNTGIYLSRKLKFKARKLLETLIEIERQEVIESLISLNCQYYLKETTKLLHVLDGGRSQVTLPNIYNSILTRCYPSVLDEKQKSTMNSEISVKTLGKFLLQYVESIDNDSISDIWTFTFQFFKEVIAHPSNFKVILPDLLKTLTNLMCKLSNTKFGEQGRSKKDLGDIFMKLLMIAVRGELVNEEKTISDPEKVTIGEDSNLTPILKENAIATQSSLLDTLTLILTRLNEFITDLDKITSCINTILVNLVSPQIKNKKINEIPSQTISLILLIGENYPTKSWRSTVLDCFMDNSFFKTSAAYLSQWEEIIQIWINNDKEKWAN